MDQFRAYLIDDEPLALKRLARLLNSTRRVQIVGSNTSPDEALRFLSANEIDVLFLDIHMTTMNGFELLSCLPRQPRVVFTTAFDEYALKAFEVNSIDYLLKPIDPTQLDRALNKLATLKIGRAGQNSDESFRRLIETISKGSNGKTNATQRMWSRSGDKIFVINLDTVSHFYAENRLTYAATDAKHYAVDFTIAALEEMLHDRDFVRVHRSTLINLAYLDELHRWFGGGMVARLKDRKQTKVMVARSYARTLKTKLRLV